MKSLWICLSMSLYVHFCSGVNLAPKTGFTLLGNEYYFRCEVRLKVDEVSIVESYTMRFSAPDASCEVKNWKYCNTPFPENPVDAQCGCIGKTGNDVIVYLFAFYRKTMTKAYHGKRFNCRFGDDLSDNRGLDVVGFTKMPGPITQVCVGNNLTLNWAFLLNYDFYQVYTLSEITWKLEDNEIGRCSFTDVTKCSGTHEKDITFNIGLSQEIPKLIYHNIPLELRKSTITITMKVLLVDTENKDGQDSSRRDILALEEGPIVRRQAVDSERKTQLTDPPTTVTTTFTIPPSTTITTTSTTTTTTTTTATTTTPEPIRYQIKRELSLTDSTSLNVLEPPSESLGLDFTGTKTLDGNIIVSCELSASASLGNPPVNLSIWHNDEIIVTRDNTHLLRYKLKAAEGNLTCSIVGDSALCLSEDLRDIKTLDVKDIQAESQEAETIDFNLLMYGAEIMICLILMTWCIALIFDHIRFLIKRQRRILEMKLMVIELRQHRHLSNPEDDLDALD
ncbi:uncharacterized protein LOC106073775 [Biomphalaria glabrata]|uniref:Uncharacterized protein LOC106073775 n=1 Tax=Biomphalaria glabrata TaxID=6526 RepID=A0A9W2Z7B8_BIOGL|nr:uncharacterized protein LOC106073775 [Biomphalaria glabrata]